MRRRKRLRPRWQFAAVGFGTAFGLLVVGSLYFGRLPPAHKLGAALVGSAILGFMVAGSVEVLRLIGESFTKTKLAELLTANGGRVTVFELASKIGGDLQAARDLLEDAVASQEAELLLAEDGTEVFAYRGILSPRQLAEARSIDALLLERDAQERR